MFNINNLRKLRVIQLLGHKNQYVIIYSDDKGYIYTFQSYDKLIAMYYSNGELFINWNYWDCSKTTLKHFKEFINSWTLYHYENKVQFVNLINKSINIHTFNER